MTDRLREERLRFQSDELGCLAMANRPFRVLTTYSAGVFNSPSVRPFAQLQFRHCPRPRDSRANLRFIARNLWRNDFDAVLVEGGDEALRWSVLKMLFLRTGTPLYSNMVYFENPPALFWKRALHRVKLRLTELGTTRILVLSEAEVDRYHTVLGIDRKKLRFIPFKFNAQDFLARLRVEEGNFIYSGGDSLRDYETLFEAVRPLGMQVRVVTHLRYPEGAVPGNVEIVKNAGTDDEYYGPCARSMFAVFPIQAGYLRSSGQGSYLGAMFLGKAVIVSNTPGVRELITDRETGLLVPPGDTAALRAAIEELARDPALRRKLGRQAHEHVKDRYTHDNYVKCICAVLAEDLGARARR